LGEKVTVIHTGSFDAGTEMGAGVNTIGLPLGVCTKGALDAISGAGVAITVESSNGNASGGCADKVRGLGVGISPVGIIGSTLLPLGADDNCCSAVDAQSS
jgi:hypothetical protein